MATQVNRQAADPYQASPSGYLQNSSLSFDFQAVLAAVYRSRFWVAGIICLSLILGVIVSLLSTPIYRGEASIQIDQEAAQVLGTEDQAPAGGWQETERFLQTQLDVIRSRAIAILVAEDLGLFGNPQFLREMNADPEIEATPTMSADEIQRRRVLTLLRENLEVALPADSRVAEIRFLSPRQRLPRTSPTALPKTTSVAIWSESSRHLPTRANFSENDLTRSAVNWRSPSVRRSNTRVLLRSSTPAAPAHREVLGRVR